MQLAPFFVGVVLCDATRAKAKVCTTDQRSSAFLRCHAGVIHRSRALSRPVGQISVSWRLRHPQMATKKVFGPVMSTMHRPAMYTDGSICSSRVHMNPAPIPISIAMQKMCNALHCLVANCHSVGAALHASVSPHR